MAINHQSGPSPTVPLLLLAIVLFALSGPWFVDQEQYGASSGAVRDSGPTMMTLLPLLVLGAAVFVFKQPARRYRYNNTPANQQPWYGWRSSWGPGSWSLLPARFAAHDLAPSLNGLFFLVIGLFALGTLSSSWNLGGDSSPKLFWLGELAAALFNAVVYAFVAVVRGVILLLASSVESCVSLFTGLASGLVTHFFKLLQAPFRRT